MALAIQNRKDDKIIKKNLSEDRNNGSHIFKKNIKHTKAIPIEIVPRAIKKTMLVNAVAIVCFVSRFKKPKFYCKVLINSNVFKTTQRL